MKTRRRGALGRRRTPSRYSAFRESECPSCMNVSVGLITNSATPPSSRRHRVSLAPARGTESADHHPSAGAEGRAGQGTGAGTRRNRRDFNRYCFMYLSSTIFESGRKIGGKTSSLHFGLKKASMFEVLTSCVFSIAFRKSMKRGTDSP